MKYLAILLDAESQASLRKLWASLGIESHWTVNCHHVTLDLQGESSDLAKHIGDYWEFSATHLGLGEHICNVFAEGLPVDTQGPVMFPHITLAHSTYESPSISNKIFPEKEIKPISLSGEVTLMERTPKRVGDEDEIRELITALALDEFPYFSDEEEWYGLYHFRVEMRTRAWHSHDRTRAINFLKCWDSWSEEPWPRLTRFLKQDHLNTMSKQTKERKADSARGGRSMSEKKVKAARANMEKLTADRKAERLLRLQKMNIPGNYPDMDAFLEALHAFCKKKQGRQTQMGRALSAGTKTKPESQVRKVRTWHKKPEGATQSAIDTIWEWWKEEEKKPENSTPKMK